MKQCHEVHHLVRVFVLGAALLSENKARESRMAWFS